MKTLVLVSIKATSKKTASQAPFESVLQRAVLLLRACGLLTANGFPELLSPIEEVYEPSLVGKKVKQRFLVRIGVRKNFNPSKLWLKFNRRGDSIYVSKDRVRWVFINSATIRGLLRHNL